MARSSIRLVRNRQAAMRDYNRLVALNPVDKERSKRSRQFLEGVAFIQRDVLKGWTPEESFDLSTSVKGASAAFHDGANAGRQLYSGHRSYADKLATAYGVELPR